MMKPHAFSRRGLHCLRWMLVAAAVVGLNGCGDDDGGSSVDVGTATLVTIDAGGGSIVGTGTSPSGTPRYELVLSDASNLAVWFTDRPVREAASIPLQNLVANWEQNGWAAAPPAALLTVRDQAGVWVEAFLLSAPQLAGGELRFVADSLDDVVGLPESFVDADLFLQPAGETASDARVFSLPGTAGSFERNQVAQGSGESWTLEIEDVSPVAAYLWTGTAVEAGPLETGAFIDSWPSFGFDTTPPNASLTVRSGNSTAVAVVALSDPIYDPAASTLRFTAVDVQGSASLPRNFAESDLFIDSAGTTVDRSTAYTKLIGIDYDFEARCSDDNWSTTNPPACNPQPSFMCPSGDGLALCPSRCQACFNSDLNFIKGLGVGAIMIYNPNYYALKAAQSVSMKVLLGTFNDALSGLAKPDAKSGCTYSGSPTACGATYARYLLDGACGSTSPWDPNQFCSSGTFITPFTPFLKDGTVIGIQIGNEVLANGFTKEQAVAAARTLRGVLDSRGYTSDKVPIVISLILGTEAQFCSGGRPPANVDLIAAHPYCSFVAGTPPSWPASGTACLDQVKRDYVNISQAQCGAANVFIGETGMNTGCPNVYGTQYVADARTFVSGVTQWACEQSLALFHFAFVDACPRGGCLAGCALQPTLGNGYFGLYYTQNYLTKGSLVPKLNPMPSLVCP